ncbi:MAG: radical SAM protein, partial [Candidatus Electryonea clarkiae]|nr:radical SAM protein [Candidatus Electryonea clarkiae]
MKYLHTMLNIESKDILSFDLHGLEKLMVSFGYKAFHGQQVYAWIYRRGITDYDKMTDLQKDLRKKLFDNYPEMLPKIIKEVRGSGDQSTTKFLLEAEDKQRFEVVNIPTQDRNTLCVSCQVGCVYNCKFCATGSMGFKRNLTYEEIVGSYFAVQNRIKERITNIVFMGMGEPLINLKNVMQAWNIFTEPDGIGISRRKVTISTVGIPDQIRVLALEPYPPKLVFSICSPHEEIRRKLLLKAGK